MPIEEVAPGVFTETAYSMANVGCIVTGDGVVLVDAPVVPSEARKWGEFVRSKGSLRYFLCTHEHPDHIGGHGFFSEAEMVCHESIKEKFAESKELLSGFLPRIGFEDDMDFSGYSVREPTLTFTDRMSLRLGGRRIGLIGAGGHTPHHAMVWLPDDHVLFSGDNVVNQWPPFCHDAVLDGWHDTLNRIYREIHPHLIIPGHGPVCDATIALNVRDILENAKRRVRDAIVEGKTREEAIEAVRFTDGFEMPKWFSKQGEHLRQVTVGRIYDHVKG
ncbi:MAG: MBL fold metallo-hydrolase [Nitrospinota bacterium]